MQQATPSGFLSLGQPTARRLATRAMEGGRGGRTLLVHGPVGAGKGTFVDDLLALLLCATTTADLRPCNACRGCHDARARTHPDLVVGSPETWREDRSSGESIVAAARRWLLAASGAPVVADRRIVLIEAVDRAGEQVQNALLKVLEEPTDRHTYILVADEPSEVLPTIRSRAQPLRIGAVPREELVAHLVDTRRVSADRADTMARIANGLAGTAIAFADDGELLTWRRRVQGELLSLLVRGPADRFGSVRDLLDETARASQLPVETLDPEARTPASVQRRAASRIVEAWLALTRDLLVAASGRASLAPSRELAPDLEIVAARVGADQWRVMASRLEGVLAGLDDNGAPRLALEAAMLAWPRLDGPSPR